MSALPLSGSPPPLKLLRAKHSVARSCSLLPLLRLAPQRGSWNRENMIGARLMRVVLDPADPLKVQHYVPFMCGGVPLDKCAAGGPVPPANKNQNKYRGACRGRRAWGGGVVGRHLAVCGWLLPVERACSVGCWLACCCESPGLCWHVWLSHAPVS